MGRRGPAGFSLRTLGWLQSTLYALFELLDQLSSVKTLSCWRVHVLAGLRTAAART